MQVEKGWQRNIAHSQGVAQGQTSTRSVTTTKPGVTGALVDGGRVLGGKERNQSCCSHKDALRIGKAVPAHPYG